MSTISEHISAIVAHSSSMHNELSQLSEEHGEYANEWLILEEMHAIIYRLKEAFDQRLEKENEQ